MNDFYRHKKGDKIKWVFTGIAFVLVFVFLVGLCMQLFGTGKIKPSEWFKKPDTEQVQPDGGENEVADGMLIAPETTSKSMRLTAMPLSASADDDGISAYASNSYSITATITPDNATNKEVTFTSAWANSSSSWASGKSISDYVTLNASGLTATLTCKQAFGEQIIVTCTSNDISSIKATCTVDYAKRLSSAEFYGTCVTGNGESLRGSTSSVSGRLNWNGGRLYVFGVTPSTSIGTVNDTYTTKITLKPSADFKTMYSGSGHVNTAGITVDDNVELSETFANQVFGSGMYGTSAFYSAISNCVSQPTKAIQADVTITGSYSTAKYTYYLAVDPSSVKVRVTNVSLSDGLIF